ncbi:hypothetical protein ABIA38_008252 [Embleya sp. AB8]
MNAGDLKSTSLADARRDDVGAVLGAVAVELTTERPTGGLGMDAFVALVESKATAGTACGARVLADATPKATPTLEPAITRGEFALRLRDRIARPATSGPTRTTNRSSRASRTRAPPLARRARRGLRRPRRHHVPQAIARRGDPRHHFPVRVGGAAQQTEATVRQKREVHPQRRLRVERLGDLRVAEADVPGMAMDRGPSRSRAWVDGSASSFAALRRTDDTTVDTLPDRCAHQAHARIPALLHRRVLDHHRRDRHPCARGVQFPSRWLGGERAVQDPERDRPALGRDGFADVEPPWAAAEPGRSHPDLPGTARTSRRPRTTAATARHSGAWWPAAVRTRSNPGIGVEHTIPRRRVTAASRAWGRPCSAMSGRNGAATTAAGNTADMWLCTSVLLDGRDAASTR